MTSTVTRSPVRDGGVGAGVRGGGAAAHVGRRVRDVRRVETARRFRLDLTSVSTVKGSAQSIRIERQGTQCGKDGR